MKKPKKIKTDMRMQQLKAEARRLLRTMHKHKRKWVLVTKKEHEEIRLLLMKLLTLGGSQ